MNIHTPKHLKPWLVSATLLLFIAALFIARTALARVSYNTIDTVGIVADKGRQVTVTGPIAVTAGERTELRVTVTQRSTGAMAEGVIFFTGTGQTNQWNSRQWRRVARHSKPAPPPWSVSRAVPSTARPPTRISGW